MLNGFDYFYVVTSLYELRRRDPDGTLTSSVVESAIETSF